MFRLMLTAILFTWGVAAQIYVPIGATGDGCVGGAVWASPALRYGNFTCSVLVDHPGQYQVTLAFSEPNVTVIGGRLFDATINGWKALSRFDLVASGATSPTVII